MWNPPSTFASYMGGRTFLLKGFLITKLQQNLNYYLAWFLWHCTYPPQLHSRSTHWLTASWIHESAVVWTWTLCPQLVVLFGKVMRLPFWGKYNRSMLWSLIAWPQLLFRFLCIDTMGTTSFQFRHDFLWLFTSLYQLLWTVFLWNCELKIHSFSLINFSTVLVFFLFICFFPGAVVLFFCFLFQDHKETNSETNTLSKNHY